MTALISKLKLQHSLSTSAWPNYGLDVLNITMHTEVVIHSMNAYVWCWSKICGSLDEIPSLTMGSCKSKILLFFIIIILSVNNTFINNDSAILSDNN